MSLATNRPWLTVIGRVMVPASCAMTAACVAVSHPEYPSSWVALKTTSASCSEIAGVYEDIGDWIREGYRGLQRESLGAKIREFKSMKLFAHPQPHRVIITFAADGALDVWTEYDGLATGNVQFSHANGEMVCRNGTVEITRKEWFSAAMVAGWQTDVIWISKAGDDSLVVKYNTSVFGVMFGFVPAIESVTSWSRHGPVNR